ncbi:uncharacterized protein LOC117898815 isoform X1 [Drosophila subobscura]|uniref:uncharacterized protein LOC117898815 isoform X1 n=1 Tax=Drosophila subobscura TaxID=7241 RepID=UPI00155B0BDD|nr:uncharacterized protein LOC117898815 isoform X1 [Drosophila subobscura]
MAFSTQKEFFHVPFKNAPAPGRDCPEACVKLKSYPSTIDDRSWSASENKKSRFVADLVACHAAAGGGRGNDSVGQGPSDGRGRGRGNNAGPQGGNADGLSGNTSNAGPQGGNAGGPSSNSSNAGPQYGLNTGGPSSNASRRGSNEGAPATSNDIQLRAAPASSGSGAFGGPTARKGQTGLADEYGSNLVLGDSLINAADDTIGRMESLMIKNNILKEKLADSKDQLKTAQQESAEIKRIMAQRYDPDRSRALKKKVKELSDARKIDSKDERELNEMMMAIDDMNKAHDILEAENANLKRLIEKQSKRCNLESIKIEPEKSSDIPYLQKKIETLGKELVLLRQAEDECMKAAGKQSGGKYSFSPEKDVGNIQKILAERDALRRKCQALTMLNERVGNLKNQAQTAEYVNGDLEANLDHRDQYISDMHQEIEEMQNFYEGEVDKVKGNEELLLCRCNEMKKQLEVVQSTAQKAEGQTMEIDVLRNELRKRDAALSAYGIQYEQLMNVVAELNQMYGNQRADCGPFTDKTSQCALGLGDVDANLAVYTGATLDHIMSELSKQGECFQQMNQNNYPGGSHINNLEDCNRELNRLRNLLREKDGELGDLYDENDCLCVAAEESKKKLEELDQQVRKLDDDTRIMEQGFSESISLIKDIGDVAVENEKLKNKVSELRDSEAQTLFDDLSKQLEDCKKKTQLLEEKNKALGNALRKLGVDPDAIEREAERGEGAQGEILRMVNEANLDGKPGEKSGEDSEKGKGQDQARPGADTEKGKGQDQARPGEDTEKGKGQDLARPGEKSDEKELEKVGESAGAGEKGKGSPEKEDEKGGTGGTDKGKAGEDDEKTPEEPAKPVKQATDGKGKGKLEDKTDSKGPAKSGNVSGAEEDGKAATAGASKAGKGGGSKARVAKDQKKPGAHGSELEGAEEQFDDFVRNTVRSLAAGEIDGCGLEKELRKILDLFVEECGFCFCKCNIPNSRFYAICHKLYHRGLTTLSFNELAYIHKRIYAAAEYILPGCLFNHMLQEGATYECPEQKPTIHSRQEPKCYCDPKEGHLLKKVIRLETDIENAKVCLKNLKNMPKDFDLPMGRISDGGDYSPREQQAARFKKSQKQKCFI